MHAIDTDSRSTFNLLLKSYSILLNQQFWRKNTIILPIA
jgi:hypothetical protein